MAVRLGQIICRDFRPVVAGAVSPGRGGRHLSQPQREASGGNGPGRNPNNKGTNAARYFQRNHDCLLAYRKSGRYVFNKQCHIPEHKARVLARGWDSNKVPGGKGQEKIRQLPVYNRKLAAGEIGKAKDDRVVYRDDKPAGTALPDAWSDIKYLASAAKERANYPTQKPLALLHRIIAAASNPGDVALDPFAGGATAGVAAEQRGRRWLGIEIGEEGYRQVVRRMRDTVKLASKDTPLLLEPERVITRREELPGQRTDYPLAPPPRVKVEDKTKEWLFGVQRGYCIGCAAALPLHILAVDHAIPRAQGGPDAEWNYQLLCSYCNPVKGDRLTTQQLWAVNQASGVLTDIERVRRLGSARARERRDKGFPGWPLP